MLAGAARSVLHCIPTAGGGGAERQLAYLAGELTRLGWGVHVVLVSDGPNVERLRAGGAVIHRMAVAGNYDPRIFTQLVRTIRAVRPDLVQTWFVQMEILGGTAATLTRTPWILSERSTAAAHPPTLKNRWRAHLAARASAIVANSSGGDRYWADQLGSRVPRYVIPNALPLEEIAAARPAGPEETGLDPDEDLVLYVGRLAEEKNLRVLLSALRRVVSGPRRIAALCGDGPLRPTVERWLGEHGIAERVRLTGYVSNVWSWMKRASVMVSPSLFEGRPNAVLEAMACGCPLVVSDIPAHREVLDEESALLIEPELPEALAGAILTTLSVRDAARRRAERARARVEAWSIPSIGRQYDEVYRAVMAERTGVRSRAG